MKLKKRTSFFKDKKKMSKGNSKNSKKLTTMLKIFDTIVFSAITVSLTLFVTKMNKK